LSVCDGLGGKPGGNDAFEQGVAGEAILRPLPSRNPRRVSRSAGKTGGWSIDLRRNRSGHVGTTGQSHRGKRGTDFAGQHGNKTLKEAANRCYTQIAHSHAIYCEASASTV